MENFAGRTVRLGMDAVDARFRGEGRKGTAGSSNANDGRWPSIASPDKEANDTILHVDLVNNSAVWRNLRQMSVAIRY